MMSYCNFCMFALLLRLSSSAELHNNVTDDSSVTCVIYSWFLPGFGPLRNSSWTALDCSRECSNHPACQSWNWRDGTGCYLKSNTPPDKTKELSGRFVGGDKHCRPGGVQQGKTQDTFSDGSCITVFWFLPGFRPLKNSSWTAVNCSVECSHNEDCTYWDWEEGKGCFLKTDKNPSQAKRIEGPGFLGGSKNCKPLSEGFVTNGVGQESFVLGKIKGLLEEVQQEILQKSSSESTSSVLESTGSSSLDLQSSSDLSIIPAEPPLGQRCSGRNYGERRCCSPENPCDEGEGDCDGHGDGGQHDGNAGCKGSLVCGSNNCKQFGTYFHEKDDCCQKPAQNILASSTRSISKNLSSSSVASNIPSRPQIFSQPPQGQRCSGRKFGERGCCSSENPCKNGEGDCEGDSDCKEGLFCGNNNCKKFGSYFHKKDDCCEKPSSSSSNGLHSSSGVSSNQLGPLPGASAIPSEPPLGQRCSGRNFGQRGCCSSEKPCNEGEGDCEENDDCNKGLVCGNNNCKKFGIYFHKKDDCCEKTASSSSNGSDSTLGESSNSLSSSSVISNITSQPPQGQRCSGRNFGQRGCCSSETSCNEGEGDCEGDSDCKVGLVCGNNNCRKFGTYYHEKDDCCEKISSSPSPGCFSRFGCFSSGESVIRSEPPLGQRCSGRNYGERRCCSPDNPCDEGEGDCDGPGDGGQHDGNAGCKGSLVCGSNNCKQFGTYFHEKDDCCQKPSSSLSLDSVNFDAVWSSWGSWSECELKLVLANPSEQGCGVGDRSRHRSCSGRSCKHTLQSQKRFCNIFDCPELEPLIESSGSSPEVSNIPDEPSPDQRCRGRNYGERRCCSPQKPCDEGEGDCDGPGDGGQHDGNAGCKGSLVCGSNNCKQFGSYYHEKDDCCERPSSLSSESLVSSTGTISIPSEPPKGQRCSGRNYGQRRCCSPEKPCDEGEGDCDGPGDGGQHDGNSGCKGGLVCGSNNCKQFGTYFHEKDDCCQKPPASSSGVFLQLDGWSSWGPFTECSKICGGGKRSRIRTCVGKSCKHTQQSQDRNCNSFDCKVSKEEGGIPILKRNPKHITQK